MPGLIGVHVNAAPLQNWQANAGYRSLPLTPASSPGPGFSLLPAIATGISFTNSLPEQRHLTNQILLNGSGVAAGDIDGDGWTDLYFCGLDSPNVLYRNLGNWKFEDISSAAGVECPDILATGSALADLDGDSDLDLIVNSVGQGTHIFFNDGRGKFTRSPAVLNSSRGGMSLALGDLDRDGFLDLYIANYRTLGLMDIPNARATFKTIAGKSYVETFNGRPTTSPDLTNRFSVGPLGGIEENGEPDLILRNTGGTNFVPLPLNKFLNHAGEPLTSDLYDWGLAVAIRDINGDQLPDIYVCNDFQTEDRFWIQQTNGTFRLASPLAQRKTSLFSMAVDFADINRDGHVDFFLADMLSRDHSQRMRDMLDAPPIYTIGEMDNRPQYSLNTLFLGNGDGSFAEIARLAGLHASEWSWSAIFLDVDLDGWEDILISNGMERAARDLDIAARMKTMRATRRLSDAEIFRARKEFPRLATANLAFRNKRDLTFEDVSAQWKFNLPGISHGMALADLDNDGDLDAVMNNLNAVAAVYRNESTAKRIAVRLKGAPPNTHGIGATIRVHARDLPVQSQEIMAGGRYLSSDDPIRTFAAGETSDLRIEIDWPTGKRTSLTGLKPNHLYEIDEAAAQPTQPGPAPKATEPLFEDVSHLLAWSHAEEPFDDFARQPLLPRKLSQPGPVAAWIDLDGDGWDDLVLGASKGQPLAAFRNDRKGGFKRFTAEPFNTPFHRDATALARVPSGDKSTLLVALSNYEDATRFGPAISALQPGTNATEVASAWDSSVGALAIADIDGDGDNDLFAGGDAIPARYPAPATSRLFRNDNGKFSAIDSPVFRELGLVNGAIFADVDNDKDPDLLLACEWGAVRLLLNDKAAFTDATKQFGLDRFTGLWTSLAATDFDHDGRIDFVAGNWGRNSKYEPHRHQPLKIFYGDFDEDGTLDIIESHFEPTLSRYVPFRQLAALGGAIPFVNARFRSNLAYSKAGVQEILGDQFSRAEVVEANWFETTVFLNRGDRLEARPLPVEAQFSPALGLCTGDFDGDSHPDIVLAQNFFALEPHTPRYDAGRSLLLKGNGKGDFTAIPGKVSGLLTYGEQRSVAASDYDKDGRLDLVITQNGAPVKLYRNRRPQ